MLVVEGKVERRAVPGEWTPVRAGDLLRADESLRTGVASRAELALDQKSRITVGGATDLTVRGISRAVHRFRLTRGRIAADYAPDAERVLRIEGASGEVAVEARAARFHIVTAGVLLAVATETGQVNLKTDQGAVDVRAGEQATARAGAAPAAPAPIAAEVLLKLASAGKEGVDPCAAVKGRVEPGTQVTVNGEPAEVDAAGRFRARPRPSGTVSITAVDPAGRSAERKLACRPDWHPVDDLQVRWRHAKGS